jgi:hypothetical protein
MTVSWRLLKLRAEGRAFRRERSDKNPPKALGSQPNFVINFCQIVFAAKPLEIDPGADHESIR